MKKVLALLLALVMILGLAACGDKATGDGETYKFGMVCIGDENAAYDRNFYAAADAAKEYYAKKGVKVEWIYKYNNPVEVADDNAELAEDGCLVIVNNSYGQEPQMLITAADYPDTVFVSCTNYSSQADDLENTVNAMPAIHEARYLAGVAAGCKLQEMIDNKEITADEAVIGYVGAYTYSEVLSGYTAFYLGAKRVCPSVTMLVEFIGSWGNMEAEAAAAQDLIDRGAVLISQHSDNTSPATTAQDNGVYHVGYNIAMSDVAPEASIISSRIDWTNYFIYIIGQAINGEAIDQDYFGHGLADGDVCLTDLNEDIAAKDTEKEIKAARKEIEEGKLEIFDTSKFTVGGQTVESAMIDTDGDFDGDDQEAISDGVFRESYYLSAPQFGLRIDGITLVNEAY